MHDDIDYSRIYAQTKRVYLNELIIHKIEIYFIIKFGESFGL